MPPLGLLGRDCTDDIHLQTGQRMLSLALALSLSLSLALALTLALALALPVPLPLALLVAAAMFLVAYLVPPALRERLSCHSWFARYTTQPTPVVDKPTDPSSNPRPSRAAVTKPPPLLGC
jgi:hypothetical protein